MKKMRLHLLFVLLGMATVGRAQRQIPLPEHPLPDIERLERMNLNGEWGFTFDPVAGQCGVDGGIALYGKDFGRYPAPVSLPGGSSLPTLYSHHIVSE